MSTPGLEEMRLLRNLAFAGAVSSADEIIGFQGEIPLLLESLVAAGLIEVDGVIAPTDEGLAVLEQWYAEDRDLLTVCSGDALHEQFRPLDRRVKVLASAWQDAETRDDWDARMVVVEGLDVLHADTLGWLDHLARDVPRFVEYRDRLSVACEHVLEGETDYVVKVELDSYHTIWFQMHEDLLRLLGRERDPE